MDRNFEVLLNSKKNAKSIDVDTHYKIELNNNTSELELFDIAKPINISDIFENEREETKTYRIYGDIEYLSILNGLKLTYNTVSDFFNPVKSNGKTIINSFDFYLVRPAISGYTSLTGYSSTTYVRYFQVIATYNDFDIYNAGFSKNIFNEQKYIFNFSKDFDISDYYDNFNFPITELFLYAKYKPTINGNETLRYTEWQDYDMSSNVVLTATTYNVGDFIYGDLIEYSDVEFNQTQIKEQEYYIRTGCYSGTTAIVLQWKYNPFIPIRLNYLSNELYYVNTGDTQYDLTDSIPEYATIIFNQSGDTGNRVWRIIQPQGYFDPITNIGIDPPFINENRYLFNTYKLSIVPDLNDNITAAVFREILFGTPLETSIVPNDNINNLGKPCQ